MAHPLGPSLSADGTIVAFTSSSTSLVTGDTNAKDDVFLRNTVAATTIRISIGVDGARSNNLSDNPSIAADGKTIAFHSDASNLVPSDTNNLADVFVRGPAYDRSTYGYDRLYRLTSAVGSTGSPIYGYDPVGNRTSKVLAGTTTNYAYDRADRITAGGSTSITVNANGNTTAKGSDSFTYALNNRASLADRSGRAAPSGSWPSNIGCGSKQPSPSDARLISW